MADATTLIREPGEALKAFNKRIHAVCNTTYVTDINLAIIDGMPAVTLMTDVDEATEEDVENGDAEEVGDPLSGPPICGALAIVRAETADAAQKAEEALDKLYNLADGAVTAVEFVTADHYKWIENPNKPKADPFYAPAKVTYVLCTWDLASDDDDDKKDDTPEGVGEEDEVEAKEVEAEVEKASE